MDLSDAGFKLTVEGSTCVLRLSGSFHLELAQPLHQAALEAADHSGNVLVDCSQAQHLDGCTLQILLALQAAMQGAGRSFGFTGANEQVRKDLTWAGLTGHFGGAPEVSCAVPAEPVLAEPMLAEPVEEPARPRKRRRAVRKRQT